MWGGGARIEMSSRGLFIVFEGLDRCGKTTQVNKLLEYLTETLGVDAIEAEFPDRKTDVGGIINSFLRKELPLTPEVIHLLYSANRWEKRFVGLPKTHYL